MNSIMRVEFIALTVQAILSVIMTTGIGMIITGTVTGITLTAIMAGCRFTVDIITHGITTGITILTIEAIIHTGIHPGIILMTITDMGDMGDMAIIQITGILTVTKIIIIMVTGTVELLMVH